MKKKLLLILCAVVMLTLISGCGQTGADPADSNNITITDHAGNQVEVPADIEKIAVVGIYPLPSVLSVFFNSAEKIVAMPKQSMAAAQNGLLGQLYPEILNADTASVSGETINTEALLALDPDVVFYSASDSATGDALKAAGFTAIAISVNKWEYNCIETLNQWISLLSQMFPQNDKAAAVSSYSTEVYDMIQSRVSALTAEQKANIFVLFQYSETTLLTSGKNFFGQWWCDAIGANNVAVELTQDNSVAVNMEQVYSWNPDVILVTNFTAAQPADLYNSTIGSDNWSGIQAVKDKRVYKMPLGMYRSYTPGADTPVTLLWLAKTVYPDLFSDIDVTQKAKEYYQTVFGIELTDTQVESIFAPSSDAAAGF